MHGARRVLAITLGVAAALSALSACQPTKKASGGTPNLTVNVILGGLNNPWDLSFAPDAVFFTERTGTINAILTNGQRVILADPPDVRDGGEGGMLGIAVDPNYASNRLIYTCFSSNNGPDNRIVRWQVPGDFSALVNRADIVTGLPYNVGSSGRHSGCRLKIGSDGFLWAGTGDAAMCDNAQNPNILGGKVLRVDGNGIAAPGNAFGRVWSLGHRNVQGLAFRPGNGQAYSIEHGSDRDDEVNIEINGANYGWAPGCPYNEGVPMTFAGGQPAVWSSGFPTIAPSGATFLSGPQWKGWNGALAVAVLKAHHLRIFFLSAEGGISGESAVLTNAPRLRSAVQGPDGNLYITTDVGGGGGQIWQVIPS